MKFFTRKGESLKPKRKKGIIVSFKNWDLLNVSSKHKLMEKEYGKKKFCERCHKNNEKEYQWANIDHRYKNDRKDWMRLCAKCHAIIDRNSGFKRGTKKYIIEVTEKYYDY